MNDTELKLAEMFSSLQAGKFRSLFRIDAPAVRKQLVELIVITTEQLLWGVAVAIDPCNDRLVSVAIEALDADLKRVDAEVVGAREVYLAYLTHSIESVLECTNNPDRIELPELKQVAKQIVSPLNLPQS